MRFSDRLFSVANEFRRDFLSSDDETDGTILPSDWRDETIGDGIPKGGEYICGHLRRQDFLYGRSNDVPSLKNAAQILEKTAQQLGVQTVFVASDGSKQGIGVRFTFCVFAPESSL